MMINGPTTGMRVEFSTAFEVLAHELRGCTSVVQGYVRLLQQARGADAPDAGLLAKLMDATGRLTTLGRQASDVATWSVRENVPAKDTVTMTELLAEATELHREMPVVVSLSAPAGEARVAGSTRGPLAAALGAVFVAVARNNPGQSAMVSGHETSLGVTLHIGAPAPGPATVGTEDAAALRAFLAQGGQNLSLVLASHILAAHGAQLTATSARPAGLQIQFATLRGPQ